MNNKVSTGINAESPKRRVRGMDLNIIYIIYKKRLQDLKLVLL
jgi:hypothetical protein